MSCGLYLSFSEKHLTDKEASVPVCRVEPIKVVPVEDPIIVDQVRDICLNQVQ